MTAHTKCNCAEVAFALANGCRTTRAIAAFAKMQEKSVERCIEYLDALGIPIGLRREACDHPKRIYYQFAYELKCSYALVALTLDGR